MANADRLGIITLTRTPELFAELVQALEKERMPGALHLVVNNAVNPDVTSTALENRWGCVEPGRNTTFSEGNNLAARVAIAQGCTHLLLINDDMRPYPGFVSTLWAGREQTSSGVTGGIYLHTDAQKPKPRSVNHAGTLVYTDGRVDHIGRYDALEEWSDRGIYPVVACTFAAVLIPSSIWQRLGGLDTRYVWGWEDTDFCLRVVAAGGTNYINADARGVHGECGTRPRGSMSDLFNAELFMNSWQPRLIGLLRDYFDRVPNVVGVRP